MNQLINLALSCALAFTTTQTMFAAEIQQVTELKISEGVILTKDKKGIVIKKNDQIIATIAPDAAVKATAASGKKQLDFPIALWIEDQKDWQKEKNPCIDIEGLSVGSKATLPGGGTISVGNTVVIGESAITYFMISSFILDGQKKAYLIADDFTITEYPARKHQSYSIEKRSDN